MNFRVLVIRHFKFLFFVWWHGFGLLFVLVPLIKWGFLIWYKWNISKCFKLGWQTPHLWACFCKYYLIGTLSIYWICGYTSATVRVIMWVSSLKCLPSGPLKDFDHPWLTHNFFLLFSLFSSSSYIRIKNKTIFFSFSFLFLFFFWDRITL